MSVLIYDIMPPKRKPAKKVIKKEDRFLQVVTLLLVVGVVFNWAGYSGIVGTVAYLNDTESSQGNAFVAGALDFVLGSPDDFMPSPLSLGSSALREIEFTNNYNFPKYQVRTDGFNGELCHYLILEGSVDGRASISMPLKDFVSGIVDFSEPMDLWSFKITLPATAPKEAEGKTCQFKFIFFGSQIKNDLPFGEGFNDTEEIASVVISEKCEDYEIKSQGYWKNHPEIYAQYLPQTLGNYVVDTTTKAGAVFSECGGNDMSDKLRCQLLAMKFNVAHFGVGGYFVKSCGNSGEVNKTIDEIVIEADNLLKTCPQPPKEVLEAMKDLLDCLNNLGTVEICGMGGEEPMIVINKVYYDVDKEHGTEPYNEFIELYNPSRNEINLSNWTIGDNTSQDVIPSGTIIPAHGYLLITGNSSTFGYWDIPDEVIKIVLSDGEIGNGLANTDDRVILKTPDGVEVDAMSYGTDTYAFNPSCPDVDEGHMLGRYPNGFDTDTAADWKDYGLPTVHVDYPNGGETFYVGRSYHIKWTATNPSGSNSDLLIDLYYSADSGATWANIVMSTENDGDYYWRVPLFIGEVGSGYYVPSAKGKIKAVAHNKNNFMVNDWDMTDKDFCPPIDYSLLTPEEAEYLMSLENLTGGDGGAVEEVVETINNFVGELFDTESSSNASPEDLTAEQTETENIETVTTDTEQSVEQAPEEQQTETAVSDEPASNEPVSEEPITSEPISADPIVVIEKLIAEPIILPQDTADTAEPMDTINTETPIDNTNSGEPVE